MEDRLMKSNPRVGPSLTGESHTSASAGVRPSYTGGSHNAKEEKESRRRIRKTDDKGNGSTDTDRQDGMMTTASEGEGGSRVATPVSHSVFQSRLLFGSETEEESGSGSAASQILGKENERGRFLRKRRGNPDSPEKDKETRKPASKRGRGRPPTTKHYGLTKAQKEHSEEQVRALEFEIERENSGPARRSHRLSESSGISDMAMVVSEEITAAKLGVIITESLGAITSVAQKSKNLKGTSVAALRKATDAIQEACFGVFNRTASAETKALEAANARLLKELEEMKHELEIVKRKLATAQPQSAPVRELDLEELLQRAVREAVFLASARMDARLEGLEARLLPEPRLRPPLAADKKNEKKALSNPVGLSFDVDATASTSKDKRKTLELEPTVTTLSPPLNPGPAPKKKKVKKSAAAVEAAAMRRDTAADSTAAEQPASNEWSHVVKKKKGQIKKKEEETKKVPKRKRKKGGLRAPKTAAAALTLLPEAEKRGISYKDVLEKAKQRVNLADLEIPAVKFKMAVTGARLLVVPGAANKEKADKLAEKLKEVLEEDVVRIHRPLKCAELRVHGLDDTATSTEVAQAVALTGNCAVGEVKVGEIRRDGRGRGTVWVKCPVEAAKNITAPNVNVYVGWTIVRVVLLGDRPMLCYRCHEAGHTRATCKSEVDRSELCLRCGQLGHMSSGCENAPHCALCEAHDRTADHIVGTKTCGITAPKKRKDGSEKSKAPEQAATTSTAAADVGVELMEAS